MFLVANILILTIHSSEGEVEEEGGGRPPPPPPPPITQLWSGGGGGEGWEGGVGRIKFHSPQDRFLALYTVHMHGRNHCALVFIEPFFT